MKDCDAIQESLGAWLDGELSPRQSEAVRAHAADCRECAAELRQLEKLHLALNGALAAQAAQFEFSSVWRGAERRIGQSQAWYDHWLSRGREFFSAARLAWSVPAAIALVLAVISVDSFLPGWRGGGARNNFAAVESIDGHGRNVALLRQNETKTTVIWLYEEQEGENEVAEEPSQSGPAF